ncbi:MAG: hypothetical protein L6Q97_15290 [Thermoanaerobaculia bacterium]|nr:hypothetical protein [Thermoanaerobaculia bacterium]
MGNRKTINIIIGAVISLVGLLAGLAELTGYNLRDLFSEKEQQAMTGTEALTKDKDTRKAADNTKTEGPKPKTTLPPEADRTAAFIGSWYDITYAPESRNRELHSPSRVFSSQNQFSCPNPSTSVSNNRHKPKKCGKR